MVEQNIFFDALLGIFPWLVEYLPLLSFLAPIVGGGEAGVIVVAFLFANTAGSFFVVLLFSFLGMMFVDSVWFFIGRSRLLKKVKKWNKISKGYKIVEKNVERITKGRDILILLIAKVLVGTRILIILYISGKKNINFGKFVSYLIIPNLVWGAVLVLLGWAALRGFVVVFDLFDNIRAGVTFLIVIGVGLYILQKWVQKKLMKKLKQKN